MHPRGGNRAGFGARSRDTPGAVSESLPPEPPAGPPADIEKSLERQIRAFHWIRLLAELPDRTSGSAGEREAGARVLSWMQDTGFEEITEQRVPGSARPGARLALSFGLGALACALGGITGLLLAGLALTSFRREERRGRPLLSRLLPARDSLNVVARTGARRPRRRVVLSASLDSPQAGRVFSHRLARALRQPGPGERGALVWCERGLAAGLVLCAASALGASGALLVAAQVGLVAVLLLAAAFSLEWALARPAPGANDASGVAALLTCAEQLAAQLPEDGELWLVAAGAGQNGGRGLAHFVEAHGDWRPERTLFVHFDRLGGGALHYLTSEGALERTSYPPRLPELARRLCEGGGYQDVTPCALVGETDARQLAARELHALSLVALDDEGVPRADHALDDAAAELDIQAVVRAADFGAAVVVAGWRGESDPLAII